MELKEKLEKVVEILTDNAEGYEVSYVETEKQNVTMPGIFVRNSSNIGFNFNSPSIFEDKTEEEIAEDILSATRAEYAKQTINVSGIIETSKNWDIAKKHLVACVCPQKGNEKFLKDKVWYKYLDLADIS